MVIRLAAGLENAGIFLFQLRDPGVQSVNLL